MEEKKVIRGIIRTIVNVIIILSLAFLLSYSFLNQKIMQGHSMEPVLTSGDTVLLNRVKIKFFPIKRFDIICTYDNNIKRVIGLPGERLKIANGFVYINDEILNTPNKQKISTPGLAKVDINIGENEYFVMGDNPDSSEDSRVARIGNIKLKDIEGTIWFTLFPIKHFGIVR